jgi:FKBP-type peptidyl-prolyl cis-trans isomerase SlyD
MVIDKNTKVTFTFEMKIGNADGEQIQQFEKSAPMTVVIGQGDLLEPFEQQLMGLKAGDDFEFVLLYANTYGPYREEAVHRYDRTTLITNNDLDEDDIEEGMYIPIETPEGLEFSGLVAEITPNTITVDFNHPLAGKDLFFKGTIIEVRESANQ